MTKSEYYQWKHDSRTAFRRASMRIVPSSVNAPRHCQECGKELSPVLSGQPITTKNLICDACVIESCKNLIAKRMIK
jgi:hypothetical protein